MKIGHWLRAAPVGLLVLSGCGSGPHADICSDFGPRIPHINAIEGVEIRLNAIACVEHWAARLSFSEDPATTVADAAMGACQAGINEGLFEIEDEDVREDWRRNVRELAIFRAVQQRAGNCGIPDLEGQT